MTRPATPRSELGRLIDLVIRLRDDEGVDPGALRDRDAEIAAALGAGLDRRGTIDAWLDASAEHDAAARRAAGPGADAGPRSAEPVLRTLVLLLVVAGGVLGVASASLVFGYTGRHPVNVVTVLAAFVFVQLLTLAVTAAGMTPGGARRLPGLAAAQDALRAVSPGRLARPLSRLLPGDVRHRVAPLMGEAAGYHASLAGVRRWVLLAFAQWFGLAFNAAALLTAASLVTFTDLAFGWSTTLDVDAAAAHRVFAGVATPWAWAAPAASPSLELVEQTRYFRLEAGETAADPVALGRWWPFLIAAMATYGVLPRVMAWAIARRAVQRSARDAIERLPGLALVRMRLERGRAATEASAPTDSTIAGASPSPAAPPPRGTTSEADEPLVIAWAGAPSPRPAVHEAGGGVDVSRDRAAIDAVAAADASRPAMVVTKSWEPPLAELFDFVASIASDGRGAHARPVWLLPVGADDAGEACPPDDAAWRVWRDTVAARGLPGIRVLRYDEVAA